jgi:hypothetical protein
MASEEGVLPESQSSGLTGNLQFTNNEDMVFEEKKIKLLFIGQREGCGQLTSQSSVMPLQREKVHFFFFFFFFFLRY